MKKLVLLSAVIIALGTSCKKDYTCECIDNTGNVTTTQTIKGKSSKKAAQSWCDATKTGSYTVSGGGFSGSGSTYDGQTCSLK
ncbi:MAG: hypothetical protein H0W61_09610 [Bacteroidetes bacterium]|nr:hypothetical protein [Bacteroidota bacterium]